MRWERKVKIYLFCLKKLCHWTREGEGQAVLLRTFSHNFLLPDQTLLAILYYFYGHSSHTFTKNINELFIVSRYNLQVSFYNRF